MLTSEMIKKAAFEAGADLCGIGPMSRFEGAPPEMDPAVSSLTQKVSLALPSVFPEAYSVVSKKAPSSTSTPLWHTAASTRSTRPLFCTT